MVEGIYGVAGENYMTKKDKEYYKAWAFVISGIIIYAFAIFGFIEFIKNIL